MAAGPLRTRVTFQTEVNTPDLGGGSALTWANTLTVWGQLQPERGRERVEAGRLESALAGVLRVRSSGATRTFTAENRVLIDSEPYQIRSISNPDMRDRWLEIVVEKGIGT